MTIGAALVLIAAGAILRFAISTVSTHGVDLHTIGVILMIVGVLGLILWMFVWAPWVRRRSSRPPAPPVDDDRPVHDPYRDPYRSAGDPYRPGERSYHDPYPR